MLPAFLVLILLSVLILFFISKQFKSTLAIVSVLLTAFISSWFAISAIKGVNYDITLFGGPVFGNIPVRLDGLSAWFILLTNFTFLTAILYGSQYMKMYDSSSATLNLHYLSFIIAQLSMIGAFIIQNALAFLCAWEMISLSAFILVIFEHHKMDTLKAGLNYLIQSHIGILFLTLGFIWVYAHTSSFDFKSILHYTTRANPAIGFSLFFVFFIGFAFKAGFVPFHTWLPHAHPAAPSHVSGILSAVIIKTGIFGIFRMLLLIHANYLVLGYFILGFSVISGLYGVILAIVQHNVKRLLAYHSIENIGIIGIGIGIGTIGRGLHMPFLVFVGYAGALLHTLNHSLFKSLLFYTAGTVYQAIHTLHIDRMGGLIKKMPHSAFLFLLASLAICGLPPFNGFISEFLIYSGLFNALNTDQSSYLIIILSVMGLVLIGGLALLCFTKAFGIIFLGSARHEYPESISEGGALRLIPKYMVALFITFIGLAPQLVILQLQSIINQSFGMHITSGNLPIISLMQKISFAALSLIILTAILFLIRQLIIKNRTLETGPTWGCGYETDSPKLQYTASSFVKAYAKLARPLIKMRNEKDEIRDIVPKPMHYESHTYDKIENSLVDVPIRVFKSFLGRFKFLQNGRVQFYVLYGVVFIVVCILIPLLIHAINSLAEIIKQL